MLDGEKVYKLLTKTEVQKDFSLSSNQISSIYNIKRMDGKNLPGVSNLLTKPKATIGFPERLRRAEEAAKMTDSFRLHRYYEVLSSDQTNRLQQVILQSVGLKAIVSQSGLDHRLELQPDQTKKIRQILTNFDGRLDPLYFELKRGKVAGLSPDESPEGRESKVKALMDSIAALEKSREASLTDVLSPEQKEAWKTLLGPPLQVRWNYDDFMDWF